MRRITERGVRQVASGRMASFFVQGEYGIGKTSLASLAQQTAEIQHDIHPIYCTLGGCKNLTDVAQALFQATVRSRALDPTKSEQIRNIFAKYIGKQNLFGAISLNLEALRADSPQLATPFGALSFLGVVRERLGSKGIFLVLDEINGLAKQPELAHFVKGLVDSNGILEKPLPLLLMVCGVEQCRRDMIEQHQPIDRVFEIVEVEPMGEPDATEFFQTTFESVNMICDSDAARLMSFYSAGFPKMMQLIGDAAYWIDEDNHIDRTETMRALFESAQEVGRRYFDQQVLKVLKSSDYRSILNKIAQLHPAELSFSKNEVADGLTESERGKFDNFLQKLKGLNVIRAGDKRGEWVFSQRMVRFYIWLQSLDVTPRLGADGGASEDLVPAKPNR